MNKKTIIIVLAVVVGLPIAWYLLSPLFINRSVHESMADLLTLAGKNEPTLPTVGDNGPRVLPENMTPPPGKDPVAESKGPTSPPPSLQDTVQGVGQGMFSGLAGHSAEGKASLLRIGGKFFVRLEDDFRVTNGPDLFVGFGKNGVYDKNAQIAALKGNEGGQNYEVPATIDAAKYNEVWIWCRSFSVPFGKASLN